MIELTLPLLEEEVQGLKQRTIDPSLESVSQIEWKPINGQIQISVSCGVDQLQTFSVLDNWDNFVKVQKLQASLRHLQHT